MSKDLQNLQEKRSKVASDMVAMNDAAKKEDRGFTAEERSQWDKMADSISTLESRIETEQRAAELKTIESEVINPLPQESRAQSNDSEAVYRSAFNKFIRYGAHGLNSEERDLLREKRAQGTTTGASGGYTVPGDFSSKIIEAKKAFGGIAALATVINTSSGNTIAFPTTDGTGEEGEIITENTAHNEQDGSFGEKDIGSYAYSSKIIRVSEALLEDNAVNVEGLLTRRMGMRLGRIQAKHFATGTDTGQPQGLLTAAAVGHTAASNSALVYQDFLELKHSVDPAYRMGAAWVFNDGVLKSVKSLVDTTGRPLYAPSIASAAGSTIDGDKYVVDQGVAGIGSQADVAAYGDISQYLIRNVNGIRVKRLTERYADFDQVGFLAIQRTDAALLDTGAVKKLRMAL